MFDINKIKLFLLDMDGTFYLENKLLPGAKEFLEICEAKNIKYLFLTNNSSKSAEDYVKKLEKLDVHIACDKMFTSADATLLYLAQNSFSKDILLIGTQSLESQFIKNGYNINAKQPKAVVLGFDTSINFEKLTSLCNAVRSGIPYIATHPDYNCPVENGYIPDIGAVIAFVNAATGKEPTAIIGKPNAYIAKAAAKIAGVKIDEMCMVGDRLYTDIALGKSGCKTAFVLSGEGTMQELLQSECTPDIICDNLAQLCTKFD